MKAFKVMLLAAILLGLFCVPALAASPSDFAMVVNDTYVNLRSGPSQDTDLLGSYQNGEWLTVKGQSGNWFYVQGSDGKTGYVSMTYTSKGPQTPEAVAIVNNPNTSSFLNFRQSPSYDAKVLDILYNGVPCRVISRENGWVYVNVDGIFGYLRNEFLRTQSMLASDSVATVTTSSTLNLRQGPGTGYAVTKQFKGGTYVMLLLKGNNWSKVSVDGYVGYMDNSFLTLYIVKPTGGGSSGGGGGGYNPPSGSGYGVVGNQGANQLLNLREDPTTSAKVIGRYMNGTRVTILAQGTEWCRVQVDKTGLIGYMMTKFLKLYNLPSTPTATVSHPLRSFVNLRKSTSMNAGVLVRVPHGKKVTVVIPGDDWYKVKYDGMSGYMVEYFLIK